MENNKVENNKAVNNTAPNGRPVINRTTTNRTAVNRAANNRVANNRIPNNRAANNKAAAQKRKKKKQSTVITVLLACILVVTGIIAGFALGRSTAPNDVIINSQTEDAGLSILSISENGEWITVKTSYITLRYPFAFSDIIEVEAFNEGTVSQLRFYSKMDGKRILNYIVHFNDNEGLPCGTLKLKQEIPVSVEFKEAPKKLSKDWLSTFYAVQETFNDVLKSMEENIKFSGTN